MTSTVDLLVIGSGPAGIAAAMTARRHGLSVTCLDEQPSPGGQIWRAVETVAGDSRGHLLGSAYLEGAAKVAAFRASGASYLPGTQVWQIEPGFEIYLLRGGQASALQARKVLLATGAQERPAPFPGWTLPGVLTVGAAQILLKTSGEIPLRPVWIVGCGPLPLLYATQLIAAGGSIAGWLDTASGGQTLKGIRHGAGVLAAPGAVLKGIGWMRDLRRAGVHPIARVTQVSAHGSNRVEKLCWTTASGATGSAEAEVILIHEGVIPSIHAPLSVGCDMRWDEAQECFAPAVDEWGETSQAGLFVAGDGAGIGGSDAATLSGELAALRAAVQLGYLDAERGTEEARPVRRNLRRALAVRPLLDALYLPRAEVAAPSDSTIVCRCEEITAGQVRASAGTAMIGMRQFKAMSRSGMGPCQGRQCGATINRILADAQRRTPAEVGPLSVRPPLKPLTLGELATLAERDADR